MRGLSFARAVLAALAFGEIRACFCITSPVLNICRRFSVTAYRAVKCATHGAAPEACTHDDEDPTDVRGSRPGYAATHRRERTLLQLNLDALAAA
jgi:hypothetical protein